MPETIAGWQPPMPPTDLIFDDGEPLETNRHRIAINVLIDSINQAYAERDDFFAGGNMFIYYSSAQARNREFRGPDFFVVLNIDGSYPRQGWVVWEENGRYPDVIVELMSPSTAMMDLREKKNLYEQIFKTRNYFVYNPFDPDSLQGWSLDGAGRYQPLSVNEQGWLWSEPLGLWLGTWSGTLNREQAVWLRFYDQGSNLVLLPKEIAQQEVEAARQDGLKQGALRQVLRLLSVRFGTVPPEVEVRLQTLSVTELEELIDGVLGVNSVEELRKYLA